jgi:4-hydroxy-tetrahydrodipicolinate reductase
MDVLPVVLSSGSLEPSSVRVRRDVNLARRRERLREKLGVGLTLDAWNAAGGTQQFGHVGLLESAYLCALGLGWKPLESSFDREPICAESDVVGVREVADVRANGRRVALELAFRLDGDDEDRIEIDGDPPFSVVWHGGIHGDTATTARIVQAVRVVQGMRPGLRLPIEIPAWSEPAP